MYKALKYYPNLSVIENAKNGVSEALIRLYIKEHAIGRRGDDKALKIDICRRLYRSHKDSQDIRCL